jgi:hypothetical protein
LVRFKLQSIANVLRTKVGKHIKPTSKNALNPFSNDIRNFKTIFDVEDAEGMMDFGVWILMRCEEQKNLVCSKVDPMIELFYLLMRQSVRDGEILSVIIEESFEEIFATMQFSKSVELKGKALELAEEMQDDLIIHANIVCARLNMGIEIQEKVPLKKSLPTPIVEEIKANKSIRIMDTEEKELLRQSFVQKTTAIEYIEEIGGDVLEEIRDLESLDSEWSDILSKFEEEPSIENMHYFVDRVLGVYVRAINNLFEFTALAYAISSLGSFMKEHADEIISDSIKVKTLVMLIEHLGSDLVSWREHIFGLQDAGDIHYLDSSFFSSCMQIEQIIGNKNIENDDDNDMEFF